MITLIDPSSVHVQYWPPLGVPPTNLFVIFPKLGFFFFFKNKNEDFIHKSHAKNNNLRTEG